MDGRDGELTLEELALRLETLERENTELHKEVAALRGTDTGRSGPAETRSLVPRGDRKRVSEAEGVAPPAFSDATAVAMAGSSREARRS